MRRKRAPCKAPVLFGERMRLALTSDAETIWVRVYGDVSAQITLLPGDKTFPFRHAFAGRPGAAADTLVATVRMLESLIRRSGPRVACRRAGVAQRMEAHQWLTTSAAPSARDRSA
jgi:hypothetical protein